MTCHYLILAPGKVASRPQSQTRSVLRFSPLPCLAFRMMIVTWSCLTPVSGVKVIFIVNQKLILKTSNYVNCVNLFFFISIYTGLIGQALIS